MERWDFDCQLCGRNIGNAWFVPPEWYACPQEMKESKILEEVYPETKYFKKGEKIILEDKNIPLQIAERIKKRIKEAEERRKEEPEIPGVNFWTATLCVNISFRDSKVKWHEPQKEEEYYEKAGIKKHVIKGRGRGRLGYTFDSKCAEKLNYKCPVCGSELVKVTADQHPGGHWGIIDEKTGKIIREPGPMI